MPSLLMDEKNCFIRLVPNTLQNFWRVIMLLWYVNTCVKVFNIKGSTFKGECTLLLDLGLSLMVVTLEN